MSAALAAALSTAACTSGPRPAAQQETARAAAAATKPAVDLAAMDRTVDPCDDFYRFACGGWIKSTPVPADRALWNRSFSEILQRNELVLRKVLEDDAAGKADQADPYAAKAGDFYAACMDEGKAEAASLATLRSTLASIEAVHDRKELAEHVAQLQLAGASALFSFFSAQDAKDARQVIGRADQGGLGMPDRNYYLKDEPKLVAIRTRYRETLQNLLVLAGDAEARAGTAAEASLRIETALAKASLDRVERRDPYKVYHRLERAGLAASAPHFD
jgi:endothelin-converting enzyme/putative endopeptidase